MHLMYKDFVKEYWYWISHGEVEPQQYDLGYSTREMGGSSHTNYAHNECYVDHMDSMIGDAMLANENVMVQEGSSSQEPFYNMVQAVNSPYKMIVQLTVSSLLLFGY